MENTQVNVSVTIRSGDPGPAAKDYAAERVGRVVRVFERLDSAKVILDHEHGDYQVEATLTAPKGGRFFAKAQGRDLRAAIDAMASKLESQVRSWKDQLVDHRGTGGTEEPRPPAARD